MRLSDLEFEFAMAAQNEGILETHSGLSDWLKKWRLTKYEQVLKEQGIETPNDFKYIKSKEQFDSLVKNIGNIPFMHILKLQDAWHSMVPLEKQQQQNTKIHFLGDDEREIMDKLDQRYNAISDDINILQKANKEFNDSAVESKEILNEKIDQLIVMINQKREYLLHQIDDIIDKNSKSFSNKLNDLNKMSKICLYNKQQFDIIAASKNLSTTQKLPKLEALLTMNMMDDDEKQSMAENYDNYKIIGDQCIYAGKMNIKFDAKAFNQTMNSFMKVECNSITKDWTIQQNYSTPETFVSNLISRNDEKYLLTWISNIEQRNVSLLFRASRDGFDLNTFHSKCDDKVSTLVIVKSEHNHIFGGYTEKSWKGPGNWVTDKNAWIYLLRSPKKDKPAKWKVGKNGSGATQADAKYGPYFGDAFYLTSGTTAQYGGSNSYDGPKDITVLAGSKYYTVLDWEVWHISN